MIKIHIDKPNQKMHFCTQSTKNTVQWLKTSAWIINLQCVLADKPLLKRLVNLAKRVFLLNR